MAALAKTKPLFGYIKYVTKRLPSSLSSPFSKNFVFGTNRMDLKNQKRKFKNFLPDPRKKEYTLCLRLKKKI